MNKKYANLQKLEPGRELMTVFRFYMRDKYSEYERKFNASDSQLRF